MAQVVIILFFRKQSNHTQFQKDGSNSGPHAILTTHE